jgi:hypothetical protein
MDRRADSIESVSDRERARTRCFRGRRSRVVLTPRRRRQVSGVLVGPTGLGQNISADDGDKNARSPGRARNKPLKPLRAEMPGDSGVPVASTPVLSTFAQGAAGAAGTRHSPRPQGGESYLHSPGCIPPRGRECLSETGTPSLRAKRSNPLFAMTVSKSVACWLFENCIGNE